MAGFNLWATDPENKPKPRQTFSDDAVGRLHGGYMDTTGRKPKPVALSEWRFSTGDKVVADALAQLFGGTPAENDDTDSEHFIDVFTEAKRVPVIVEPDGIEADMKQWVNGKLIHHCDGVKFLSPDDKRGDLCGCPSLFAERKAAAKDYQGPNPSIKVTFRLADDPELGKFTYSTGSWTLAAVLHEALNDLDRIGETAYGYVELEYVEFIPSRGPMRGKTVSYTKPVLKFVKPYNDAIAD
ncbi:recombination directionality factor [Streptomyces phage TG1]|uniref:Recombination directionality factor n=1 Tax=Streptomyces phage TG1 TaxID=2927987 RepID=K4I334_9CAUD|nr:hypothetical protein D281_gp25 [Streptomyces phage TG1]AFU62220.1 recombination directionality factor [Streptomyces phage TG1]